MRFLVILLFIFNIATAQRFVYVSSLSADTPLVGKLFLYENGESKPLIDRLEADDGAYDPSPSPDGQRIAYMEKNGLGWSLVVVDLTGSEMMRWDIPGSQDTMRPAGGFYLTWLDEQRLLAQVTSENGWDIFEFRSGAGPKRVTEGFGIFLSPNREQLLTNVDGDVLRVDLKTRQSTVLSEGEAWGWFDDERAVVFKHGDLYSVDVSGDEERMAELGVKFLAGFSLSPDRSKFALLEANEEGFFLHIYDGQQSVIRQPLGPVDALEWLDDETLLLSYQKSEAENYDSVIATFTLTGTLTELVNSDGSDSMARPLR